MEMVYLINGNESGGGGGSGGGGASAGYPLVKAVVTGGAVGLQDRSVTRVELTPYTLSMASIASPLDKVTIAFFQLAV